VPRIQTANICWATIQGQAARTWFKGMNLPANCCFDHGPAPSPAHIGIPSSRLREAIPSANATVHCLPHLDVCISAWPPGGQSRKYSTRMLRKTCPTAAHALLARCRQRMRHHIMSQPFSSTDSQARTRAVRKCALTVQSLARVQLIRREAVFKTLHLNCPRELQQTWPQLLQAAPSSTM